MDLFIPPPDINEMNRELVSPLWDLDPLPEKNTGVALPLGAYDLLPCLFSVSVVGFVLITR